MISLRKTPTSVDFEFKNVCHTIKGENFTLRSEAGFSVLEIDLSGNFKKEQAGFQQTDTEYLINESDNLLRMTITDNHLVDRLGKCQGSSIEIVLRLNEGSTLRYKADTVISNGRIMFKVTERK